MRGLGLLIAAIASLSLQATAQGFDNSRLVPLVSPTPPKWTHGLPSELPCNLSKLCEALPSTSAGIELRFDILETGAIKNPTVSRSCGAPFDAGPVFRSLLSWRFNPRVHGGRAVPIPSVCVLLRFDPEPPPDGLPI
jgi:hypothetical protein